MSDAVLGVEGPEIYTDRNLGISPVDIAPKASQMPQYVQGEIIIKFENSEELKQQAYSLEEQGKHELSSMIKEEIAIVVKERIHQEENFTIKGEAIKEIEGLPDKIKSLVKEETILTPLYKGLHRRMRAEQKTEKIDHDQFNEFQKKGRWPGKKPRNYSLESTYILRNIDMQGESLKRICRELSQDLHIEYAEPNYIVEINNPSGATLQ